MFNVGPMELVVLALVGLIVIGPDKLPALARDAARLIRSLREMATGARTQLRDELGPEFADVDLRNLNPRVALQKALLGDDAPDLRKFSPRSMLQDAIMGDPTPPDPVKPVTAPMATPAGPSLRKDEPAPLPEATPYDEDAT